MAKYSIEDTTLTAIADAIREKSGSTDKLTLDQMASTISSIETSELNFTIVGSTTAPASPKENTLWINTDVAIGEYIISQATPTTRADGTALQAGDVWIEHGGTSELEINALKKNGIYIRMLAVAQWSGSAWVRKEAQLYKNGSWSAFVWKLYDNGDEVEVTTGGWSLVSNYNSEYTESRTNEYIYLYTSSVSNHKQGFFCTENTIDLTNFNTITAVHTYKQNSYGLFKPIAVHTDRDAPSKNDDFVAYTGFSYKYDYEGTKETFTLDVSALSGGHYVGFALGTSSDRAYTYFYEMSIT